MANNTSNPKFNVHKYGNGWIATRKSDDMKIYFEDYNEMIDFINK